MTADQDMRYNRGFFTFMRPDLTEAEQVQFSRRLDLGERYLNALHNILLNEVARIHNQYPLASSMERVSHLADQFYQLSQPFIIYSRHAAGRSWQDASKIVNYFEKTYARVQKYGADYPKFWRPTSQEEIDKREDAIYERFVKEMRKRPNKQE